MHLTNGGNIIRNGTNRYANATSNGSSEHPNGTNTGKIDTMVADQASGKRSGGGGGNNVYPLIPDNTCKSPGWAEWSNAGGPSWRTRELCNLGVYCWMHGFDPWGFGHTSKNCKSKNNGHKDHTTKTNQMGGSTQCVLVRFKLRGAPV